MQAPLKVGFFMTDHWFEPHAAGVRAIEETVRALEQGALCPGTNCC